MWIKLVQRYAKCESYFWILTRNSSLEELCILHIQKSCEILFRGIVKKYTADLILLTKFKKIIGMKEKFAQNIEVAISLMELLLPTQESFDRYFCLIFYFLQLLLGEIRLSKLFPLIFQLIDQKFKCVSANVFPNVFPICFQLVYCLKITVVHTREVLGQLPSMKISLPPQEGNFSPGQLSGCPSTLKLTLTLTETPTLTGRQFSSGSNCPDTTGGYNFT